MGSKFRNHSIYSSQVNTTSVAPNPCASDRYSCLNISVVGDHRILLVVDNPVLEVDHHDLLAVDSLVVGSRPVVVVVVEDSHHIDLVVVVDRTDLLVDHTDLEAGHHIRPEEVVS